MAANLASNLQRTLYRRLGAGVNLAANHKECSRGIVLLQDIQNSGRECAGSIIKSKSYKFIILLF